MTKQRRAEIEARNEALEEAASHLEGVWTLDALERTAGVAVSAELRAKIRTLPIDKQEAQSR